MVKKLLEKTRIQDKEAAKALGISPAYLSRVKNGDVQLPPKYFKKAARFFKIPLRTLVDARTSEFRRDLVAEIRAQKD